ncbi:MAG: nucleotide exchange factor GrpE [Nitrososphaerales archaeon]
MTGTNHNSSTEIENIKEELKRAEARAEEYDREIVKLKERLKELSSMEERYKYKLAEIDNYRKQLERGAEIRRRMDLEKFLVKLIDLRDDYLRAIETARKSYDKDVIVSGLESILKNLDGILKEEGVREIDAVGKMFDPTMHEAMSFVATNEYPENTVTAEIRKGYILSDRVIRPSLVEVSRRVDTKTEGDLNG